MEISLPGLTPSSTSSNQTATGTSRRRELQQRLLEFSTRRANSHLESLERPPREECNSRELITDSAYHRHNRMDWTPAQRARRDAFHDTSWAEYFTKLRIPESAVHLIIGDILILSVDANPGALAGGYLEFF